MKLSDYVAEYLSKYVRHVFCGNGGVVLHLLDSISKHEKECGDLTLIPCQHEQSASIAAEAYARIYGFGCAIATSGPGFVNMLQGIACAYYDSIPVLYIVGGCPTNHQRGNSDSTNVAGMPRQQGFQEMNVTEAVRSFTKAARTLVKAEDICICLAELRNIAREGRPGPVLLEIPDNLQREDISYPYSYPYSYFHGLEHVFVGCDYKIEEFKNVLSKSLKPIVVVGGGVKIGKAEEEMNEFLNKFNIPYVCTWATKDIVSGFKNKCIGTFGINGTVNANKIIQEADLIISLGCKLDTHQTGGNPSTFAPNAKKVMIDIDQAEMNKNNGIMIDLKIRADVKDMLRKLTESMGSEKNSAYEYWNIRVNDLNLPIRIPEDTNYYVNPYKFMSELSKKIDYDAIIITDAGATLTWTMQAFQPRERQTLFSAFNHSPMGYALPAAIGAYYASKGERQIICIIGDGGLVMCSHELETIVRRNIPIKIFVMDNKGYGIMRQTQDTWLEGRRTAVDSDSGLGMPDVRGVSYAYGVINRKISNVNMGYELDLIQRANRNGLPVLWCVDISPDQQIVPKLKFGKSIGDIE